MRAFILGGLRNAEEHTELISNKKNFCMACGTMLCDKEIQAAKPILLLCFCDFAQPTDSANYFLIEFQESSERGGGEERRTCGR